MTQFQSFDPNIVPKKFINSQGQINVQALTTSAGHLGINAGDFIGDTGQVDVNRLSLAYREKEMVQGQPPQPQPQPVPVPVPVINVTEPATASEVDWTQVRIDETGKIPAVQRQSLMKIGIPANVIDGVEMGQAAIAENARLRLVNTLPGGEETYNSVIQWANTSLQTVERQAMQAALAGPAGEMALVGYFQRYVAANPGVLEGMQGEPDLSSINTAGAGGVGGGQAEAQPFMNAAERRACFRDRRWGRDRAYTEHIQLRAIATTAMVVEKQNESRTPGWRPPTRRGFNK